MITALDHLTLRASFRDGAVGAYETLLGRRAEDGSLRVGNVGLVIEDDASTARLTSMVFATQSLEKAAHLLKRRALPAERKAKRLVLSAPAPHGLPIGFVQGHAQAPPSSPKDSRETTSITAPRHVRNRTAHHQRSSRLDA